MKSCPILLLLIYLPICSAILKSFFPELPRTSECRHWSLWSKCVSTENYRFNGPFDMPGYCQMDHSLMSYIRRLGPIIETANHYFKKMNMSKRACGMCNFQYSCGRMCTAASSTLQQNYIRQRLCPAQQSDPCVVDSDYAYNRLTERCQVWPPLLPVQDVLIVFPADMQERISAIPGPKCISVEKRCLCCCDPYMPDPVTLTCKLIADDDRKIFRKATDLPRQGRRRFGLVMRK